MDREDELMSRDFAKMSAAITTAFLLLLMFGDSLSSYVKVNVSTKQFNDELGRSRLFQGVNVVRACVRSHHSQRHIVFTAYTALLSCCIVGGTTTVLLHAPVPVLYSACIVYIHLCCIHTIGH